MLDKTLILRSETEAFKAKRILSKNGIASRIIKTVEKEKGCSVRLLVKECEVYALIRLLRDNGIDYSLLNNDLF